MSKSKLEYIWLDGYLPTANLRSKTKVIENFNGKLSSYFFWRVHEFFSNFRN